MTAFLDSMPAAYATAFAPSEVAEHARIVGRRGTQLVHTESCAGSPELLCVVADDRPGLLALVTDALLVHGLSIKSAHVYCRSRAGLQDEAVDFFQLQRPAGAQAEIEIAASELGAFAQTLSELVAEDVLAASRLSVPPGAERAPTRVYFELEALRRGEFVLLVQAPDSQGLLNGITNALHGQGVRILASQIRTVDDMAHDRFDIASNDAQPLSAVRLCDIQQAVREALPKKRSTLPG